MPVIAQKGGQRNFELMQMILEKMAFLHSLIGVGLSKPHTSEWFGASVTFTKIYKDIRIHWAFASVYA